MLGREAAKAGGLVALRKWKEEFGKSELNYLCIKNCINLAWNLPPDTAWDSLFHL